MSNFRCEVCGKDILEGPGGHYVTGCPHHPMESRIKPEEKQGETMHNLILDDLLESWSVLAPGQWEIKVSSS